MKEGKPITVNAFNHALSLIEEFYPDLPYELKIKQAAQLAAKICK